MINWLGITFNTDRHSHSIILHIRQNLELFLAQSATLEPISPDNKPEKDLTQGNLRSRRLE
ncbi:hypothetical protein A6X21_16730 [Planctopirus hydrillae]|uniref:Uncharacterized protein n=1 Tax=Planctopirus hydrillae TaxID=1841610 RepID=A0A1C3EQD7_9PLAN|nr:hypothetical protein A6X21_16730 [Planctopirus hydrillae]